MGKSDNFYGQQPDLSTTLGQRTQSAISVKQFMARFACPRVLCQAQTLKDNCVSFGMPAPRLEGVDAIEEDLWATESSWALYKEYSSELKVWATWHAY